MIAATAVALAASRGDPNAPRGLFGVGTTGDGPAQAKAAAALYARSGWSAFPDHGGGSYVLLYPTAMGAVAALAADDARGQVGEAVADAASPLEDVAAIAREGIVVARFFQSDQAWQRVTKITVGAALIVVAAITLTKVTWFDPFLNFVWRADDRIDKQIQATS